MEEHHVQKRPRAGYVEADDQQGHSRAAPGPRHVPDDALHRDLLDGFLAMKATLAAFGQQLERGQHVPYGFTARAIGTEDGAVSELKSRYQAHIRKIEEKHAAEINELEGLVRAQRAELDRQAEAANSEKAHLDAELSRLRKAANSEKIHLVTELKKAQRIGESVSFKVSDDEIHRRWTGLRAQVRRFVRNHLVGKVEEGDVTQQMVDIFSYVASSPKLFLADIFLAPSMFESWIWLTLQNRVFGPESLCWAGELGNLFMQSCEQAKELSKNDASTVAQFHDWRSSSAIFLGKISPPSGSMLRIRQDLADDLRGLFKPDAGDISTKIDSFVHAAHELDVMFRKSKAEFSLFPVHSPRTEWYYNPRWMEEREGPGLSSDANQVRPTGLVHLAIVPGLVKCGRSDGGDYGAELILEKMEVICDDGTSLSANEVDVIGGGMVP